MVNSISDMLCSTYLWGVQEEIYRKLTDQWVRNPGGKSRMETDFGIISIPVVFNAETLEG